ncbi:MAG: hypothetical protein IMF01_09475 [Proteobacteria bacterium]|nr:hypothetical protein [Pseudomonadota bacterium]
MKSITQLRDQLLKIEAGKVQVNAAQMGEILSIISDILYDEANDPEIDLYRSSAVCLYENGMRRAKEASNGQA